MKSLANCKYKWNKQTTSHFFKRTHTSLFTQTVRVCVAEMSHKLKGTQHLHLPQNWTVLNHCVFLFFVLATKGPKFDQPSYPGFERDVFRTVSDYFHSLAQPLLTFQYYELFVNVLGTFGLGFLVLTAQFSQVPLTWCDLCGENLFVARHSACK